MSGRGDNNKRGSAGSGNSNQSNEGAAGGQKTAKSNHGKQTGGKASKPQKKTKDDSVERYLQLIKMFLTDAAFGCINYAAIS